MTQLVLTGAVADELVADELWQAYKRVAHRIRHRAAPNTEKAYRAAWASWERHCQKHDLPRLPVEPLPLLAYLDLYTRRAPAPAPNTVRLQFAALVALDKAYAIHTDLERPPLSRDARIEAWFQSWSRENPKAPKKQAAAMSGREFERVLELAQEPGFNTSRRAHLARYARDRALLTIGTAAALRCSELARLELDDVVLNDQGLIVTVRWSKTDQAGAGHARALHRQRVHALCPVDAFNQWLRVRGPTPGALFWPLDRAGRFDAVALSTRQIQRIVTDRCKAAGLVHVSSHTLRATFGTLAKDWPLAQVMTHGNWKSPGVALGYQRKGQLFDDSPTRGLFDERPATKAEVPPQQHERE